MGQPGTIPPGQSTAAIGYGDPAPAYAPPRRPYATTAAASSYAAPPASSATQADTGGGVYPSQSLFDLSKNSTDSSAPRPGNVVHPPNAYTPVGSSGAAPQPAAATDPAADGAGVYPQQSIADVFSGK
jgi:hypothetical protein